MTDFMERGRPAPDVLQMYDGFSGAESFKNSTKLLGGATWQGSGKGKGKGKHKDQSKDKFQEKETHTKNMTKTKTNGKAQEK